MKRRVLSLGSIAFFLVAAAGVVTASPAGALDFLSCGQTITGSKMLGASVTGCTGIGITIGANGVDLNLNGFTISCINNSTGDGPAVLVAGRSGVTVRNGTVKWCDAGVAIQNGGNNKVTGITATQNIGASPRFGDGIAVEGSSNNTIENNTTSYNGPFSGIGIYQNPDGDHAFTSAPAVNNLVRFNNVLNNTACRPNGGTCDNDGIRIEPGVSPGNNISYNTVAGNGLDGISLFSRVSGTTVFGNQVSGNGYLGAVAGDGIRVFGYGNYINSNNVTNNKAGGISVARRTIAGPGSLAAPNGRDNQIMYNTATGNLIWDLRDSNPLCDNNTWYGNTYHTADPLPCAGTGGNPV